MGGVFPGFAALETGSRMAKFLVLYKSKVGRVVTVSNVEVCVCKQFNSRWLIAESRTNDCSKAGGIVNPQPWSRWQAVSGGLVPSEFLDNT